MVFSLTSAHFPGTLSMEYRRCLGQTALLSYAFQIITAVINPEYSFLMLFMCWAQKFIPLSLPQGVAVATGGQKPPSNGLCLSISCRGAWFQIALHLYEAGKGLIFVEVYNTRIHLAQYMFLQGWFSSSSTTCTRNPSRAVFHHSKEIKTTVPVSSFLWAS